ncbi:hypothetical protein Vadar_028340 [Vaccinium darrowii]|uniref:Uncharacterized protein n=1 Tax=Vaccinium darrowii TaxID=229202 RepID=A0ACB7Y2C8_9ERIC|nr:hypothetical protein Vadar_028340 [Vaccinium darrowii]
MMPTNTYSLLEIRRMFAQIFAKLFVIKIWINYWFCLCRGAAVTTGLAFAQWFVGHAVVDVLITYFTDSWKRDNLLKAVGIVNLLNGLSSVLVLAMTYVSENHVSPLKVIVYSTAAYILGMVMLCISAFHSIPDDKTGMYFVPAVLLLSVGKSGGVPILEEFLVGQLTAHEPQLDKDEGRVNARKTLWWITASLLSALLTPKIFTNDNWLVKFICSTSVMGIGYLLFLCCIPLYHRSVDEATATEISHASSKESINDGPAVCAGSLVEQWKPLSIMFPMWSTFLVFSLVLSTADTFFSEQGNNMHPTVSIYILLMIRNIISVSWRVEVRRLHAIAENGLCVKQNAVIPMSVMRLAPQFCLVGLMQGLGKRGLDLFYEVHVSDVAVGKYGSALNEAVIGFGSLLNGLLVFLFKSWFRDTLNCSRLDKYYLMLMVVSFGNMCYYGCVYSFYSNKKETKDDVEVEETGELNIELV